MVDLIKQCWDNEPNNRPTTREVSEVVGRWFCENDGGWELKKDTEFYHQYQEAEGYNETLPDEIRYLDCQSQEVWHSKPINTKQITHLLHHGSKDLELNIDDCLKESEKSTGLTRQFKRQLSFSESTRETKLTKLIEKINLENWTNLHPNFTEQLIEQWKNSNFAFSQTQEWISVGLAPQEADFAAWLRDEKQMDSESLLNSGNLVELREEYMNFQQLKTNIEISPK